MSFSDFMSSGGGFQMFGQSLGGLADMAFSAKEAEKARSWSTDMRNTTFRAGVADAKAAGLNPILVARLGGNQTPVANMASGVNFGGSLASAQQADAAQQQADTAEKQLEMIRPKVEAEIEKLGMDTNLSEAQISLTAKLARKAYFEGNLADQSSNEVEIRNGVNKLINDWKEEHPTLTIMQAFGVDGQTLANILIGTLRKGNKTDIRNNTTVHDKSTRNTEIFN